MINTTDELKIRLSGVELDSAIRGSLRYCSELVLGAYGYEALDLAQVTTKTNLQAAFPLFMKSFVLRSDQSLDTAYLQNAYEAYRAGPGGITQSQYEKFTLCHLYPYQQYKRTYAAQIKTGIGLMLVVLHCRKALTLPGSFNWPLTRAAGSKIASIELDICRDSELLSFLRSMGPNAALIDDAFKSVGTEQKRIEWFSTYGTKLLLSSGWNGPEDVSYDDLLQLKIAEGNKQSVVSVYRTLLDCLRRKYQSRISVSVMDWRRLLSSASSELTNRAIHTSVLKHAGANSPASDIFREIVELSPSVASPKRLAAMLALPGLDFDIKAHSSLWCKLYDLYFDEYRRENYKGPLRAIGFLNLYLFYYLPYWFKENPSTLLRFPATPNKLTGSVFISRLVAVDEAVPRTFIEFMRARQASSGVIAETLYADIKQVEVFFTFIAERADEVPGCEKFKQPISKYDYPALTRPLGTDKSPLPRRLFLPFLNFVEAVRSYMNGINEKILAGALLKDDLYQITKFTGFIDAEAVRRAYGLPLPTFDVDGTSVLIRFLPLTVSAEWYALKDGRRLRLLRPNALNQILVALYTGLRHNHIQWLDLDVFDMFVTDADEDYCKLHVNTDKATKKPWVPHVNKRVIEILRSQKAWRELIDEPSFQQLHFYNDNDKTAYPRFKPLFAFSPVTGSAHPDHVYESAWQSLLLGFQSLLPELPIEGMNSRLLCRLRPAHVAFHDPDEKAKLAEHALKDGPLCALYVKTAMTPHSTRVTVVSHLISFLPPELIGKHVTGQTRATVFHYVVTEAEQLEDLQVGQARDLQRRAYESQVEGFLAGDPAADAPFIKADELNSRLAKSVRVDLPETLVRFGCVSIDYRETGSDGIDVLKEKGIEQAAFNKTEICPYGNHCPQDVIKMLKGLHRCSLCPYAVRSIDHLPSLVAREKFTAEMLAELDAKICGGAGNFTSDELDVLELERQRLGEEYAGWRLCIEVLELQRQRVAAGEDSRTWVVEKPEIIEQDLKRIEVPTGVSTYLISRLQESVQYPGFQSPSIKAEFDMLRRRVLATDVRRMSEAFSTRIPVNVAAECAGVLRSIVSAHNLSLNDVSQLLLTDDHISTMPIVSDGLRLMSPEALESNHGLSQK